MFVVFKILEGSIIVFPFFYRIVVTWLDFILKITRAILILNLKAPKTQMPLLVSFQFLLASSVNGKTHGSYTRRLCTSQSSWFHVSERNFHLRASLCWVSIRGTYDFFISSRFREPQICFFFVLRRIRSRN